MNPQTLNIPKIIYNLCKEIEVMPLTNDEIEIITSLMEKRKENYEGDRLCMLEKLETEYKEKKSYFENIIRFQYEEQKKYEEEILERIKKLSK